MGKNKKCGLLNYDLVVRVNKMFKCDCVFYLLKEKIKTEMLNIHDNVGRDQRKNKRLVRDEDE